MIKIAVTPEVNAISTLLMVLTLVMIVVAAARRQISGCSGCIARSQHESESAPAEAGGAGCE
jgi:hypothetical protein